MKELDPAVIVAVFHEMLGWLFWPLLIIVLLVSLAFIVLLLRERTIPAKRLVRSQALGLLGGVAALVLMIRVSASGYMGVGGPIDWLLILLVFVAGFIGGTILFYTVAGWGGFRKTA